jgi:hypothetical protein
MKECFLGKGRELELLTCSNAHHYKSIKYLICSPPSIGSFFVLLSLNFMQWLDKGSSIKKHPEILGALNKGLPTLQKKTYFLACLKEPPIGMEG